jgi:hypothetical protein
MALPWPGAQGAQGLLTSQNAHFSLPVTLVPLLVCGPAGCPAARVLPGDPCRLCGRSGLQWSCCSAPTVQDVGSARACVPACLRAGALSLRRHCVEVAPRAASSPSRCA